ncbi:adenylate kinase [Bienertia sinuspersici]
MDTISSLSSFPPISLSSTNSSSNTQTRLINPSVKSSIKINSVFRYSNYIKLRQLKVRVKAVDDVSRAIGDPSQAQLSWEIVVGALAGVVPFIVAGIEFSKRIVAQRRCEVCGGSGLVLRDKKYYFRCPSCGGFLPWQSWRRFFSG